MEQQTGPTHRGAWPAPQRGAKHTAWGPAWDKLGVQAVCTQQCS